MQALYAEMDARETPEAKVYKALDNLEAIAQHNFSDISTWLPNEYELNQTYGNDKVAFSEYLIALRYRADHRKCQRRIGTCKVRKPVL